MTSQKPDRREFLLSASLLSAGAFGLGQGEQDFSKVQIKVTRVSSSVYMLQGQGGNIAASVGDDGIAIVDDQFAPLAEKIRVSLRGITGTDKPVRFVINTHYHGYHHCPGQRS
jgi:cyclase